MFLFLIVRTKVYELKRYCRSSKKLHPQWRPRQQNLPNTTIVAKATIMAKNQNDLSSTNWSTLFLNLTKNYQLLIARMIQTRFLTRKQLFCKKNSFEILTQKCAQFECKLCGQFYTRKYGLKIHMRTHTGYKPLKCKYCGRAFGDPREG